VLPVVGCGLRFECLRYATAETVDPDLALLADWMIGSFSSREQAAADSASYDVRLRMELIRRQRTDGHWLYVEQAIAGHEDRPYRQRVHRLSRHSPDTLRSDVYTLPGPERFIGGWAAAAGDSATLTPDSLDLREGCAILLVRENEESFVGGTQGRCTSSLRGAAYATSEVTVTSEMLMSWDRGFNDDGAQVWGATEGAYIFKKY
jgi:hypothetical protein